MSFGEVLGTVLCSLFLLFFVAAKLVPRYQSWKSGLPLWHFGLRSELELLIRSCERAVHQPTLNMAGFATTLTDVARRTLKGAEPMPDLRRDALRLVLSELERRLQGTFNELYRSGVVLACSTAADTLAQFEWQQTDNLERARFEAWQARFVAFRTYEEEERQRRASEDQEYNRRRGEQFLATLENKLRIGGTWLLTPEELSYLEYRKSVKCNRNHVWRVRSYASESDSKIWESCIFCETPRPSKRE